MNADIYIYIYIGVGVLFLFWRLVLLPSSMASRAEDLVALLDDGLRMELDALDRRSRGVFKDVKVCNIPYWTVILHMTTFLYYGVYLTRFPIPLNH